jgi:hypothetical protein
VEGLVTLKHILIEGGWDQVECILTLAVKERTPSEPVLDKKKRWVKFKKNIIVGGKMMNK